MTPSARLRACALACAVTLPLPTPVAAQQAAPAPAASGAPALPPPAPAARHALPRWTEVVLSSGLRVVVVEHHRRPTVAMALVLGTGTLADPPDGAGATLLALHLATDYRQALDGSLEEEDSLRMQVAKLGGDLDVAATPDASLVSVLGLAEETKAYLRLLGDAVARPRRAAEFFVKRRGALLDALDDLESADPEALGQALREAAFGAGSPYARPERGTAADLRRMGLEMVEEQQDRIFVPAGATLVVVGDVKADAVVAEARKAFRGWSRDRQPPLGWTEPRAAPQRGVGYLRRQPAATLQVCAARPLAGVQASDAEVEVLAALVGQGVRSRLMRSLREEGGLAYEASADLVRRRRARAFLACAHVAGERAGEGVRRFRQVLESLRAAPPTEEEVARARALAEAAREASAGDAAGILVAWIDALVLGRRAPELEQERARIEQVTAVGLHRAAREVFGREVLWIFSGDRLAAAGAAQENALGELRSLKPR